MKSPAASFFLPDPASATDRPGSNPAAAFPKGSPAPRESFSHLFDQASGPGSRPSSSTATSPRRTPTPRAAQNSARPKPDDAGSPAHESRPRPVQGSSQARPAQGPKPSPSSNASAKPNPAASGLQRPGPSPSPGSAPTASPATRISAVNPESSTDTGINGCSDDQPATDTPADTETEAGLDAATTALHYPTLILLPEPPTNIIPVAFAPATTAGASVSGTESAASAGTEEGIASIVPFPTLAAQSTGAGPYSNAAGITALGAGTTSANSPGTGTPADGLALRRSGLDATLDRERLALQLRAALAQLDAAGEDLASEETTNGATPAPVPVLSTWGSQTVTPPAHAEDRARIVPVDFRPNNATPTSPETAGAVTQLPGAAGDPENSARFDALQSALAESAANGGNPLNPAADARFEWGREAVLPSDSVRGTSAARKERMTESRLPEPPLDAAAVREGNLAEAPRAAGAPGLEAGPRPVVSGEWPPASAVSGTDRTGADVAPGRPADAAGTVDRISKLVVRETMVLRQHASDSMAVVLRPDANTELLVHLSQRNGQIEASVRCERGDYQHLNALWSQLQESLSSQKVRLNPLQESAADTSHFGQTGGQFQGGRDESSRQSRPDHDSMDAWPKPASPSSTETPAVRSRRESGTGLSTSRPGWETWA